MCLFIAMETFKSLPIPSAINCTKCSDLDWRQIARKKVRKKLAVFTSEFRFTESF